MEKAKVLLDIVKGRRSIRRFKSNPVPKDYLDLIFEAARWAPSAGNRQSWRFIVVTNSATIKEVGEIYQKMRERELEQFPKDDPRYKTLVERMKAKVYRDIFTTAPTIIVVCGVPKESFREKTYALDCAIAIQNILLMVHALGLGSVYINFDRPEHADLIKNLESLLEIPEGIKIVAILPLGYPDEQPITPPRKEISEIVYQEKYLHKHS